MYKGNIKINNTIWNSHYLEYPIHHTLKIGIALNCVFSVLLLLFLATRKNGEKIENSEDVDDEIVTEYLPSPNSRVKIQVIELMNYPNPAENTNELKENSSRKWFLENEMIYVGVSNFLTCIRLVCSILWFKASLKDIYPLALISCLLYPWSAILFHSTHILYTINLKRKTSIAITAFLILNFAVDIFLISVGFLFLHHVTYNPISLSVVVN